MNYHDRDAAYRAHPGLNQSALKPLKLSPQHAKHAAEAPRKQSAAMALGVLTERLIACPDDLRMAVKQDGRTTAGKAANAAAEAAGGSAASPTAPIGMRLGTAATAAHKSTLGAASIATAAYIAGSYVAFDSAPAATAVSGTNTGWEVTYVTTWPAGTATNAQVQRVLAWLLKREGLDL
jgi:hypothetical protein